MAEYVAAELLGATLASTTIVGGITYGAVTAFALNIVAATVVNKIFAPKGGGAPADVGITTRSAVSTSNKVGVIYGTAWPKGVEMWFGITDDRETGYYNVGLCLNANNGNLPNNLISVYWQEYKLTLNAQGWVSSAVDRMGNMVSDFNDKVRIQFYSNGINSIRASLDNNDTTAWLHNPNVKYTGYTGAVITVKKDQGKQIFRLEDMTFCVQNTLTAPGSVILDYLTSVRYGAGLSPDKVDSISLAALDQWSAQTLPVMVGNATYNLPRYTINNIVNTTQNTWTNFEALAQSAGSLPKIDNSSGKYGVFIDRVGTSVYNFTNSDLVGQSSITSASLNDTPNSIEALYAQTLTVDSDGVIVPDGTFRGQQNNINLMFPSNLIPINAPANKGSATYPFCATNYQAKRLAALSLNQNVLDLSYTMVTNHKSLGVAAGDVVTITSETDGWLNKQFRVLQVAEVENAIGGFNLEYTIREYSSGVYVDSMVLQDNPAPNVNFPSQRALANFVPATPTITNVVATAAVPNFDINVTNSPATGTSNFPTEFMEIYFGTSLNPDSDLLLISLTPSMDTFAPGQMVPYNVTELKGGTYYFRTRYYAGNLATQFSARTPAFVWNPVPVAVSSGASLNPVWSPSAIFCPSNADGTQVTVGQTSTLVLYVGAQQANVTNAANDAAMPNSTWRIVGMSTGAGLAMSAPTYAASSVTWTVLASTAQLSTFTVAMRYKDSSGVVSDAGSAILQVNQQRSGNTARAATISGYTSFTRLTSGGVSPANQTFSATLSNVANPVYSWSVTGGTPTTSSAQTIVVTPTSTATNVIVSLSVTGTDITTPLTDTVTCPVIPQGGTGQTGDAGYSYANPSIYMWTNSSTPPSLSNTLTYNWNTGTLSGVPAGWSQTDPGSTIPGYYRWSYTASLAIQRTTGTDTSTFSLSSLTPRAIVNGTQGPMGNPGQTGQTGATGAAGSGYYTIDRGGSGSSSVPTTAEVNAAASRSDGPRNGDTASIIFNSGNGNVIYRYAVGSWTQVNYYISGSLIVQGSISAGKFVNALQLSAAQQLYVGNIVPNYGTNTVSGSGAIFDGTGRAAMGGPTSSIVANGNSIYLNGTVVATGNLIANSVTQANASSGSSSASTSITSTATADYYVLYTFVQDTTNLVNFYFDGVLHAAERPGGGQVGSYGYLASAKSPGTHTAQITGTGGSTVACYVQMIAFKK